MIGTKGGFRVISIDTNNAHVDGTGLQSR